MPMTVAHTALVTVALALVACGSAPASSALPASPPAPSPAQDAGVAEPEAASQGAAAEAPARKRKPFAIHNGCMEMVTVVFGAEPKDPAANRRTLTAGADSDGPRDDAGNQVVWLVDGAGEPLVKVNVTRGMKRVEVGRSCRTLESH